MNFCIVHLLSFCLADIKSKRLSTSIKCHIINFNLFNFASFKFSTFNLSSVGNPSFDLLWAFLSDYVTFEKKRKSVATYLRLPTTFSYRLHLLKLFRQSSTIKRFKIHETKRNRYRGFGFYSCVQCTPNKTLLHPPECNYFTQRLCWIS